MEDLSYGAEGYAVKLLQYALIRAGEDPGRPDGICVEPMGAAYSDICVLPGKRLGVVYEGAGYATINFTTISLRDVADQLLGR